MVTSACCCSTCTIHLYETFNRADSTTLGANWTEVAGDWEIASNALKAPGADAIAIWTGTVDPANFVLSFEIGTAFVANNVYRILVDYVDDDNYVCGEFIYNTANLLTFRIIDRVAGVETIEREWLAETSTISLAAGDRIRLRLYTQGTKVVFYVHFGPTTSGGTVIGTLSFNRTITSNVVGVGTGAVFTAGQFANWLRIETLGTSTGNFPEDSSGLYSTESGTASICRPPISTTTRAGGCDFYLHEQMQLDINFSGVNACGCNGLDGPYVLDFAGFNGDGTNHTAEWQYFFPAAVCNMELIRFRGSGGAAFFFFSNLAVTQFYVHNMPGPIPDDCSSITGGTTIINNLCTIDTTVNVPVVTFL